jgi:hypothetical protein
MAGADWSAGVESSPAEAFSLTNLWPLQFLQDAVLQLAIFNRCCCRVSCIIMFNTLFLASMRLWRSNPSQMRLSFSSLQTDVA